MQYTSVVFQPKSLTASVVRVRPRQKGTVYVSIERHLFSALTKDEIEGLRTDILCWANKIDNRWRSTVKALIQRVKDDGEYARSAEGDSRPRDSRESYMREQAKEFYYRLVEAFGLEGKLAPLAFSRKDRSYVRDLGNRPQMRLSYTSLHNHSRYGYEDYEDTRAVDKIWKAHGIYGKKDAAAIKCLVLHEFAHILQWMNDKENFGGNGHNAFYKGALDQLIRLFADELT